MRELKTVVVLDGEIINVGELDSVPEGATLEEREMKFSTEFGWREDGWEPPMTDLEKLREEDLNNKEAIAELYKLSMGGF